VLWKIDEHGPFSWDNYGKSPFLMGKSTVNGNVQ
jgi:hypothetical protein